MTDVGIAGPLCPVCGRVAQSREERLEPVVWHGRDHGWRRRIITYRHADGSQHRVPGAAVFDERR